MRSFPLNFAFPLASEGPSLEHKGSCCCWSLAWFGLSGHPDENPAFTPGGVSLCSGVSTGCPPWLAQKRLPGWEGKMLGCAKGCERGENLSKMPPELTCFLLCALSAPNLSGILGGDALLPAPQSISILSTNMKHFLTWSPVIVQGATVRYSVEFQGEYEREYANGSWIPISECSLTTATVCNITEDISATVAYKLRVRAELGATRSQWGTTKGFFNRATTSLTPPLLRVVAEGHHLLVELADMGPSFQFRLLYWKKGQESRVQQKVMKVVSSVVHLDTMEAGAEYCVKAQTHVEAINRSSSFSPTQCVRAQGKSQPSSSSSSSSTPKALPLVSSPNLLSLGEVKQESGEQSPTLEFAGERSPQGGWNSSHTAFRLTAVSAWALQCL
uniref:Interleukin-20 receptor subunit beta-like n=1 Tax=Cyanistes caeruleus TaxID=156563 RepID=A0A8C0ZBH5_CYACU